VKKASLFSLLELPSRGPRRKKRVRADVGSGSGKRKGKPQIGLCNSLSSREKQRGKKKRKRRFFIKGGEERRPALPPLLAHQLRLGRKRKRIIILGKERRGKRSGGGAISFEMPPVRARKGKTRGKVRGIGGGEDIALRMKRRREGEKGKSHKINLFAHHRGEHRKKNDSGQASNKEE